MAYDRLSALDASFLHLERLETPMHVGALTVFEGESFFAPGGRFRIGAVQVCYRYATVEVSGVPPAVAPLPPPAVAPPPVVVAPVLTG